MGSRLVVAEISLIRSAEMDLLAGYDEEEVLEACICKKRVKATVHQYKHRFGERLGARPSV